MFRPTSPSVQSVQSIEFDECGEIVAVVGEASYQDAIRRICGSVRWEDVRHPCRAALVPEATNKYDPNAVMVQVETQLVGYLSRGDALDYREPIRMLADQGAVAVCDARVAGRGPGSETSNLGVFLELPTPEQMVAELRELN
jgi:hypothetical protein